MYLNALIILISIVIQITSVFGLPAQITITTHDQDLDLFNELKSLPLDNN